MDAAALSREFKRLDSIVAKEGKNAKHSLERAIPHLSAIQMLTSQRGAMRKKVLAAARVPGWSDYLNKYSEGYGVSASTISGESSPTVVSQGHSRSRRMTTPRLPHRN